MQLTIQKREKKQNPKVLRKEGVLPAVLYGRKQESTAITLSYKEFEKVLHAAGESSIVVLTGLGEDKNVLIHAVDFDPVTNHPVHADFYVVEKGQTLQVPVQLTFEGVSDAVKNDGAVLVKVMHELEIEALPQDLPHSLIVSLEALQHVGDQIHVKDIPLPKGVKAMAEPEDVVVMVTQAQEEEVEAPPMDISQIEVVEKGKKEEEATEEPPQE